MKSVSRPEENSCGASGINGMFAPSGWPSKTSKSPPSSKGEEPLKI